MATSKDAVAGAPRRELWRLAAQGGLIAAAVLITAGSAILVKEIAATNGRMQTLAAAERVQLTSEIGADGHVRYRMGDGRILPVGGDREPAAILASPEDDVLTMDLADLDEPSADAAGEYIAESMPFEFDAETLRYASDPNIRWFNGRPVRPARTMWMTVTGYSPHAASCAPFDDGLTATLHSVKVNGTKLVAADTRLLPFGSMLTIPGYDNEQVVPVLDRGSAIKGYKLDLMFPTHQEALNWGRQRVQVTVWEYADGLPPDNPRAFR